MEHGETCCARNLQKIVETEIAEIYTFAGRISSMHASDLQEKHEINSAIQNVVRFVETMDADDSDDTGPVSRDVQSTRSTRGKVQLNKLFKRRARGIMQEVEFNKHGQPVGPVASEMQSYIGLLARQEVKISYKSWRQVPQEVKDNIWESVNSSYKVDQKWKTGCLESANGKWRQWKSNLFNKFIVPNQNDPVKLHRPPQGSGILQEDWSEFVIDRMSEEFKILSAEQKERRMKNIYPHRLSRRGYAGLAEEMKEELCGDDEIDRAVMWKKARVSKNGDFEDENLKKTVQRIDDYIQQKEGGLIKSKGLTEDLLTCALETPEHSGRLRAVGCYITPTKYYKRRHKGEDEKRMMTEIREQINEHKEHIDKLNARIDKLEAIVARNKDNDEKSSCSVKLQDPLKDEEFDDNDDDDDDVQLVDKVDSLQGKTVALASASTNAIVAYGTVMPNNGPNKKLHGNQFIRVLVDEAVDANAFLPIPIPNVCDRVGDAIGFHLAWPTHLVELQNKSPMKKKVKKDKFEIKEVEKDKVEMKKGEKDKVEMKKGEKDKVEMKKGEKDKSVTDYANLPKSLKMLYFYGKHALKDGEGISISVEDDVFGAKCQILVHLEDIVPFCDLEPISGNCIIVYIWHLYNKMEENKLSRFQFVNPFTISYMPKSRLTERARVLADRLIGASINQLVLVPCNVGLHWILTIIDPYKEVVFLLDPLSHRNRDDTWKNVVNRAISMFNANLGKKGKKQPTWEIIQAPRQPDSKQCGFYVMRYMRETIEGFESIDSRSLRSLFRKGEYSQKEIDEVRSEWADCLQDLI
ncbi:hypothetical protein C2S51_038309 [Perilla frutescens var. frutescens]|nr:hypothetical protein C2S51_038309 [Perilla frutescens var. frutescens]